MWNCATWAVACLNGFTVIWSNLSLSKYFSYHLKNYVDSYTYKQLVFSVSVYVEFPRSPLKVISQTQQKLWSLKINSITKKITTPTRRTK